MKSKDKSLGKMIGTTKKTRCESISINHSSSIYKYAGLFVMIFTVLTFSLISNILINVQILSSLHNSPYKTDMVSESIHQEKNTDDKAVEHRTVKVKKHATKLVTHREVEVKKPIAAINNKFEGPDFFIAGFPKV